MTATDVAGEVIDVGPGVSKFKVGDKVVSMLSVFVSYFFTFPAMCLLWFSLQVGNSTRLLLNGSIRVLYILSPTGQNWSNEEVYSKRKRAGRMSGTVHMAPKCFLMH